MSMNFDTQKMSFLKWWLGVWGSWWCNYWKSLNLFVILSFEHLITLMCFFMFAQITFDEFFSIHMPFELIALSGFYYTIKDSCFYQRKFLWMLGIFKYNFNLSVWLFRDKKCYFHILSNSSSYIQPIEEYILEKLVFKDRGEKMIALSLLWSDPLTW